MEEERVKSALEIAMERISALPELTPEEVAEQKEKEYKPIGQTIANKYLQGQISGEELKSEIVRYEGDRGEIVRAALVSALCLSIQLEDIPKAERALTAFASFGAEEKDIEKIRNDFKNARRDLDREVGIVQKKYEEAVMRELNEAGIRGSAIKPNLLENDGWLQRLSGMRRTHDLKLSGIRKMLMERCG